MKRGVPWAEIIVALGVLAAGVGVFLYAHRDEDELEETKRRGEIVVAALEGFRAELGHYPDSLPQLIPRYIAAIDEPVWGLGTWRYRLLDSDTIFQLSVAKRPGGYPALYYDRLTGRFVLNN